MVKKERKIRDDGKEVFFIGNDGKEVNEDNSNRWKKCVVWEIMKKIFSFGK